VSGCKLFHTGWWLEWLLATRLWKSIVRMKPRLWGYPKFPLERYFIIREIIRDSPNEVYCFVGVDNASISTKLQRKVFHVYWAHSGFVYLDEDDELSIRHVRWYGLLNWKLLKYLRECDEFALIRLPLNEKEKLLFNKKLNKVNESKIVYALRDSLHILPQYTDKDFWLKSDMFVLYCSEYQYFVGQGLMNSVWDYGRDRFAPDDVYKGGEVVWEFKKRDSRK